MECQRAARRRRLELTTPEDVSASSYASNVAATFVWITGERTSLGLAFGAMHRRELSVLVVYLAVVLSACDTGAGRIDTACRSNDDCAATELCATGLCENGVGVCIAVPTSCEDTDDFVCGCDGQTYQNSCFASQARVRLGSTGPCACADNSECIDSQFCAQENSCSNVGRCLARPETCDPSDMQQVCGCDGTTYENECAAFQSGVRVSALGTCECTINADCATDEYCNAITCDGPGVCESRPATCPPPEGPSVTGCDGVVYDSECFAAAEGIRVRP